MLGVTSTGKIITIENEVPKDCFLVAIILNDGEEKSFKLLDGEVGLMAAHHLHKFNIQMEVVINQGVARDVVEKFLNNKK